MNTVSYETQSRDTNCRNGGKNPAATTALNTQREAPARHTCKTEQAAHKGCEEITQKTLPPPHTHTKFQHIKAYHRVTTPSTEMKLFQKQRSPQQRPTQKDNFEVLHTRNTWSGQTLPKQLPTK